MWVLGTRFVDEDSVDSQDDATLLYPWQDNILIVG